ncbi:ribonuclease H-like domain-containing protein [Irpex rosettiformis]|uniref:Ribonuclease H-like domain-containing protein n=1 Tax=Irpex rosettiformis TaxID=378272 RepID=A0ACB8UE91_9APHY|nr:ribonuclease H-like domain-containing protein [Irpex rosettiformis]
MPESRGNNLSQASSQDQRPALNPQIVFCGTARSVKDASSVLSNANIIFMDCEGVDLGVRGGTLSIITLGVISLHSPTNLNIYIIDVAHLPLVDIQPIYDLLASSNATKVVWDGRMDYSALYHYYRVRMQNVVDLQLVDILSRESRDTPEEHLKRFSDYVQPKLLKSADGKKLYGKIHRLNSLINAVREHKPIGYQHFNKAKVDHQLWDTAPLPADYIKYAAMDIEMIAALFLNFISQRYYAALSAVSLKAKSSRYIAFWANRQPSAATRRDYYSGNGFLPLEIIDDCSDDLVLVPDGKKYQCKKCKRFLRKTSFRHAEEASLGARRSCLVCVAVAENSDHWDMRTAAMERRREAKERRREEKTKRRARRKGGRGSSKRKTASSTTKQKTASSTTKRKAVSSATKRKTRSGTRS